MADTNTFTRRRAFGIGIGVCLTGGSLSATPAQAQSFGRITGEADKISLKPEVKGLTNFYKVDYRVYRAHKPEKPEAYAVLAHKYGIRTIVDLRNQFDFGEVGPRPPIRLIHAEMETFNVGGSEEQIVRALAAIHQGRRRGGVLVHCEFGKDRTGAVIALYHMMFQGWNRERALADMISGPFGFHEFLTFMPPGRSIHGYLSRVDVAALKRRVLAMGPI